MRAVTNARARALELGADQGSLRAGGGRELAVRPRLLRRAAADRERDPEHGEENAGQRAQPWNARTTRGHLDLTIVRRRRECERIRRPSTGRREVDR